MKRLSSLKAMRVLDSNGYYTIKVEAISGKEKAMAIVPGGNSKGINEVETINPLSAVKRVNHLGGKLKGLSLDDIDDKLKIESGNVSTGISMAVHRLIALTNGVELYELFGGKLLPTPFMNVINGGVHAGNKLSFQEYMIAPSTRNFSESLMMGVEVYHALKEELIKKYGHLAVNVGMEGGFAPPMKSVEEPLIILTKVLSRLGYSEEVKLAVDCAATQFYDGKHYLIDGKKMSRDKLIDYYEKIVSDYHLFSIEDPLYEEDFIGFAELTARLREKAQVVGDDLLVTNPRRVERAINEKACNTLLLKVNQVGTVSRAVQSACLAMNDSWKIMVSHRSGDSCDPFIADLAVGLEAGQIKSGAPCRGERVSKYNRLLEIEARLGRKARFNLL
ncbi:MAG: phosphopyruvate hydratase [Candidatus Nanoarchaeia archaeon]|jgi:enolase